MESSPKYPLVTEKRERFLSIENEKDESQSETKTEKINKRKKVAFPS
jgi:hypothetical protein